MALVSSSSFREWKRLTTQAKWLQGLSLLVLLAVLSYLAVFIFLSALRSTYPYELEWTEGGSIDEIQWIAEGRALYQEPSIYFLPLLYNPLYFYLAAGIAKIIGIGFFAPRLLSILATLGTFYLIYCIVARDASRLLPGLVAVGIYAASFRFTGAWMDIAKPDSLFIFILLAAFYIDQKTTSIWGKAASGILYILAYFSKQLALPIILVLATFSIVETRGRTWFKWAAVGATGLAVYFGFDWLSRGWFTFYSVRTISLHHRSTDILYFWRVMLKYMVPAALVGFVYPLFAFRILQKPAWTENLAQNLSLVAGLVLASWSVFFKVWTYDNGFMPAVVGLSILAGLGYGQLLKNPGNLALDKNSQFFLQAGLLLLLLVQFGLFLFNPLAQIPSRLDRVSAERLIQKIRSLPGEVFVFSHGYVNTLAGKTSYLHSVTIADVAGGKEPPQGTEVYRRREKVLQMLEQSVTDQRFDWVILDKPGQGWSPYYLQVDNIFDPSDPFYPVTGALSRPELLLAKNPIARGGIFPLDDPVFEPFFLAGWGPYEHGARPAKESVARLQVFLETGHPYQVLLRAAPNCPDGRPDPGKLSLLWNREPFGKIQFTSCVETVWSFNLPAQSILKAENELGFQSGQQAISTTQSESGQGNEIFSLVSLEFLQK